MTVATPHLIRVHARAHRRILELAKEQDITIAEVIDEMLIQYEEYLRLEKERERLLAELEAYNEYLKRSPEVVAMIKRETRELEGTLADGLKEHPWVEE